MNPYNQPPWWMMMQMMNQPDPTRIAGMDVVVPARVNKAMEFLSMMMVKQVTRAAVSESQIQLIEPTELTESEQTAHETALNLLTAYFAGKMPLDKFEQLKLDAVQETNKLIQKNGGFGGKVASVIRCPQCGGEPGNVSCILCEGNGTCVIMKNPKPGETP